MAGRTTFGKMLKWIERPFQTSVSRERTMLVEQANKIRQILYDMYREFEMEVDVEECFIVQDFSDCKDCPANTSGITLPPYMQNVEAAWASAEPLPLYSKWREYKTGLKHSADCLRAVYDMPGRYPTELSLCPSGISHSVQFLARDHADAGKKVRVVYKHDDGSRVEEDVALKPHGYTALEKGCVDILSIVLPTDLVGGVVIAQKNTDSNLRILSEYQPWEHVPSYRRVKITGVCEDETITIRASRQYTDLYDDNDIVETDNRIVIENLARWLFYSESGTGGELMKKAADHLTIAKDALKGGNSRDIGINKEGDVIGSQPLIRPRLSRLRGGRRLHY